TRDVSRKTTVFGVFRREASRHRAPSWWTAPCSRGSQAHAAGNAEHEPTTTRPNAIQKERHHDDEGIDSITRGRCDACRRTAHERVRIVDCPASWPPLVLGGGTRAVRVRQPSGDP